MEKRPVSAEEIKDLADMPPLPVMQAQLLGTITTPASQLARLLAEPARQVATVLKVYVDQNASEAAA